jgi:hypothetical protein
MNLASDKPAIFEQCFKSNLPSLMADPREPKKETVRIALPPQPIAKPPGANAQSRDAVRIQLPLRQQPSIEPSADPRPPTKAAAPPQFFPPAPSPVSPPEPAAVVSTPMPAPAPAAVSAAPDSLSSGPKNETARISLIPEPAARPAPAVQMKKTQPLVAMPQITPQGASVALAPAEGRAMVDAIPMTICWTLLGVSAVILIIQIWTYFS